MTPKLNRIIFPLMSFVTLVALACTCSGLGVTPLPTAVPIPTNPPPTKPVIDLPTEAPATKPPIGGGQTGGAPFEISQDLYTHPSGAFSTTFPVGWEPNERDDGTYWADPDGQGSMDVSFINVGVQFGEEAFTNYVEAIEFNWFASFADYVEESREVQQDGSLLVLKTLTDQNGNPATVFSYYWQVGTVLYEQDFWTASDQYDAFVDGFVEVANSAETNDAAGTTAPLYNFRYTYNCPNDLCTFSVPYGWSYIRNEEYNFTIADAFKSPDRLTYVENLTYDDGTVINKSVAGAFALGLLKEFYAQDIVVTDDKVQPDGSERLSWNSQSGDYSGESFFETRGTTFLLLTWVVNNGSYDLYVPIWGDLLDTYTIP